MSSFLDKKNADQEEQKLLPPPKNQAESAAKTFLDRRYDGPPSVHLARVPDFANSLFEILSYFRRHESVYEEKFIEKFIRPLPNCYEDPFGNFEISVYGKNSKVLWCSHIDTVHRVAEHVKKSNFYGRQKIIYDRGYIQLDHRKMSDLGFYSNCLGADDGVGIWLMLEMIKAEVPGTYLFHRGEEQSGLGSSYVKEHFADWLSGFKFAIAFDRKGTDEIITHQGGRKTASNAFAQSLARQLSTHNNLYAISDDGTFTDTKNYCDIIPECTNVSCGYYSEHGPKERLDLYHAINLRSKLLNFDESKLICERDPSKKEYSRNWGYDYYGHGGYYGAYDRYGEERYYGQYPSPSNDDLLSDFDRLYDLVKRFPSEVALILQDNGFDDNVLAQEIQCLNPEME